LPNPAVGTLVVRLNGGSEEGRIHVVTVLEDGRVITTSAEGGPIDASPFHSVERRLTVAGVQLLRDELDATGLTFLTSADYMPVANPGVEPPPYGGAGPALEVGLSGGGTVVINWYLFRDGEPDYFQPQPEAEALEALATRLSTLDEWLPANAWADASARPYAPARYRIYIDRVTDAQWAQMGRNLNDLVDSATVSWPLDQGIDAFGDVMGNVAPGPDARRCGVVSAEEASTTIEALAAAGVPRGAFAFSFYPAGYYELKDGAASRVVFITFERMMPDETSCDGAELRYGA
jgi:hypothetical protein